MNENRHLDDRVGDCRRNAPHSTLGDFEYEMLKFISTIAWHYATEEQRESDFKNWEEPFEVASAWPGTKGSDWCGEWREGQQTDETDEGEITMQKEKNADDGEDKVEVDITVPRRSGEYDEGPPPSRTHDDTSHHSSPQPSDVQQHQFQVPKVGKSGERQITGGTPRRVEVPMHVTKHPEPKGRPRQTEGSDRKSTRDEGDYD